MPAPPGAGIVLSGAPATGVARRGGPAANRESALARLRYGCRRPRGCSVESVQHWLSALPPGVIYTVVALVIGVESLGIPLPGEIALVAAALLTATGITNVWWVAIAASIGAIVGDSIGYAIGRRG